MIDSFFHEYNKKKILNIKILDIYELLLSFEKIEL